MAHLKKYSESERVTKNKAKVSVIIPVFNAEKYIKQCLTSVIRQTFQDIEILCIDDGSSDNSHEILKQISDTDNRIVILEKEHTNAGDARNLGLDNANGDYIAFVDSDDFIDSQLIEKSYAVAVELSADIVHFRCDMFDDNLGEYRESPWALRDWEMPEFRPFSATEASGKIFNMGSCTPWDKLFRRKFLKSNKISFQSITTCDDMVFTYGALSVAECISTIDEVLYHQRVGHAKPLAEYMEKTISNFYIALSGLKKFLIERDIYEIYKKSFLNWAVDFSLWFYSVFQIPFLHDAIGQNLKRRYLEDLGVFELAEEDYYNHDWFEQVNAIRRQAEFDKERIKLCVPKVAVIIPVYNAGENFFMCMEQIVNQTFTDIEIILVTEKDDIVSKEKANEYAATDKRVIIVENENSFSHSGALNSGINKTTCDYFTIVEPFDFTDVTMIEKLYERAKKDDLDFVKADIAKFKHDEYGNVIIIPRNTAQTPENCNKVINSTHDRCWRYFYKSPWCTLYKTEFIKNNELFLSEMEHAAYIDEDFILKVNLYAEKTMYLGDVLYFDTVKSFLFSGYSMPELL